MERNYLPTVGRFLDGKCAERIEGGCSVSKHTPGPCAIGETVGGKRRIYSIPIRDRAEAAGRAWSEAWVATATHNPDCRPGATAGERDANERLLCSAPELLLACEALERVREGFQSGARDGATMGEISTAMDAARAAIAAAKGGAA